VTLPAGKHLLTVYSKSSGDHQYITFDKTGTSVVSSIKLSNQSNYPRLSNTSLTRGRVAAMIDIQKADAVDGLFMDLSGRIINQSGLKPAIIKMVK
jgi:hypothetical protein